MQFHWHICSGRTAIHIMREIQFTTLNIGNSKQTCLANATEVNDYAKQFKLGRWCFCGLGQEKVWCCLCPNKSKGDMGLHCQEMRQKFEEASHPIICVLLIVSRKEISSPRRASRPSTFRVPPRQRQSLFVQILAWNQL